MEQIFWIDARYGGFRITPLVEYQLTSDRMDDRLRLDMFLYFQSRRRFEHNCWTRNLQQPGLRTATMARNTYYVGDYSLPVFGKFLVQEAAQPT